MSSYNSNDTTNDDIVKKDVVRPDFVIIPDIVARDMRISKTATNLYGYIYWLAKLKDGKCTAGNNLLGYLAGCSVRMVQKSLLELEKVEYIERIFSDELHKIRSEIIPKVVYGLEVRTKRRTVRTTGRTKVRTAVRHNKNIYNNIKDYTEKFDLFYQAYPKKKAKQEAFKAWLKLKPDQTLVEIIMDALAKQKTTNDWLKDGGQFVPNPATWLNQARWEDEIEPVKSDLFSKYK